VGRKEKKPALGLKKIGEYELRKNGFERCRQKLHRRRGLFCFRKGQREKRKGARHGEKKNETSAMNQGKTETCARRGRMCGWAGEVGGLTTKETSVCGDCYGKRRLRDQGKKTSQGLKCGSRGKRGAFFAEGGLEFGWGAKNYKLHREPRPPARVREEDRLLKGADEGSTT